MEHKTLTAGGTVDLRDVADIPERLRRPQRRIQMMLAANPAFSDVIKKASRTGVANVDDFSEDQAVTMVSEMGADSFELLDQLNDTAILARVMGWSFDAPVTADGLQDLPGAVYDELKALCAKGALEGTDFSPSQDEASPTGSSTGSALP